METGTVKWFNPLKDHGMIVPDGGGGCVFILPGRREAARPYRPEPNRRVSFEMLPADGGMMAAQGIVPVAEDAATGRGS